MRRHIKLEDTIFQLQALKNNYLFAGDGLEYRMKRGLIIFL
jgi:hypothetical protein